MNIIIFTIALFMNISEVRADFISGAIFGTIIADASQSVVVKRDKFSEMIQVIDTAIHSPNPYRYKDYYSFIIPKEDLEFYYSYYKNKGYTTVEMGDGQLIFRFAGHEEKLKQHYSKIKENEKVNGYIFMGCIGLLLFSLGVYKFSSKKENDVIDDYDY